MQNSKRATMKEVYLPLNPQPFLLKAETAQQSRPKGLQVQVQPVTDQGQATPVRTRGSCTVSDLAPRLCPSQLSFRSPSDSVWQLEALCLSQTQHGYPGLESV